MAIKESSARRADAALAARGAARDEAAFSEIFGAHRARVHSVLYRVIGHNREMEDLAQEAFVEIFRALPSFRGEAKLATFVETIATRVAIRHLRRRGRPTVHLEAVAEPAGGEDPERRVAMREVARRLYGALARLEPNQRVAFALHVVDGRPLRDVAQMMEASLVATKVRVFRARRELERRAASDAVLSEFLREGRS